MCLLCAVAVNTLKLKSDVCPWISLPSNHPAANPSCTEVWWPSHCVSVYLPHSKCVLLIKLIIRVKQWQVIKSQTVITAANYRDAHKHELEDGSLQVPSICFPIKFFFQFYSTVMFTMNASSCFPAGLCLKQTFICLQSLRKANVYLFRHCSLTNSSKQTRLLFNHRAFCDFVFFLWVFFSVNVNKFLSHC